VPEGLAAIGVALTHACSAADAAALLPRLCNGGTARFLLCPAEVPPDVHCSRGGVYRSDEVLTVPCPAEGADGLVAWSAAGDGAAAAAHHPHHPG
jgi:hypothetical protein